jgi:hypothetical protein
MRLLVALAIAFVAPAFLGPAAAQSIESAYTELDLKKCRHTPGREVEDYGFWRCQGFAGIAVRVSAGDQRTYVSFGAKAAVQSAAGQTFPNFNSVGPGKIEWRREKGQREPFATILRWNIKTTHDVAPAAGRVLVVTRLGKDVCHVGYVDALVNREPNALARELTDKHARDFNCENDTRIILGERGNSIAGMVEEIEREAAEQKQEPSPSRP